jgi:hypothetical protein
MVAAFLFFVLHIDGLLVPWLVDFQAQTSMTHAEIATTKSGRDSIEDSARCTSSATWTMRRYLLVRRSYSTAWSWRLPISKLANTQVSLQGFFTFSPLNLLPPDRFFPQR